MSMKPHFDMTFSLGHVIMGAAFLVGLYTTHAVTAARLAIVEESVESLNDVLDAMVPLVATNQQRLSSAEGAISSITVTLGRIEERLTQVQVDVSALRAIQTGVD